MRINDNGVNREMTKEELALYEDMVKDIVEKRTLEERIKELEQAITMLLEGALE